MAPDVQQRSPPATWVDSSERGDAGRARASSDALRSSESLARREGGDGDPLALAMHDVSRAFLGELAALGYSRVAVDELVSLRIHGVTADFIRRVQGRSGKGVTVDRLVSMRIHGEEPE